MYSSGLKQYYKIVPSHSLPHKILEEKVQSLLELFSKIPFNQALVFSNLHSRQVVSRTLCSLLLLHIHVLMNVIQRSSLRVSFNIL